MLFREFFPTKYASSTSLDKFNYKPILTNKKLQEPKISAVTQGSLSSLKDFLEGVKDLQVSIPSFTSKFHFQVSKIS